MAVHLTWGQTAKGDFETTTNGWAGRLLAGTESLNGHPSKQQPRSTLLDLTDRRRTVVAREAAVLCGLLYSSEERALNPLYLTHFCPSVS
ncbi:hypothetical protein J6590_030426 [Homalodisca vitripennis]|nr:hypothetical protein J6590_030426 [Homalodisca vitripennis]